MNGAPQKAPDPGCLRHLYKARPGLLATHPDGERASPQPEGTLIVGEGIHLKGTLEGCDTLIVQGQVRASFKARSLVVAKGGLCVGDVEAENAEIAGIFDGMLAVRECLKVRSTGHVAGTIHYGRISMEEGGEISGYTQVGGCLPPPLRWQKSKPRAPKFINSLEYAQPCESGRHVMRNEHTESLPAFQGPK
jgi:cytoskeletal protein CcmA (bactofilin family)